MEPQGLLQGLSPDDRRRLEATIGPERWAELEPLLARLGQLAPTLDAWLSADPRNRARFEADPVAALTAEFPVLDVPEPFRGKARRPRGRPSPEGPRLGLALPAAGASAEAFDLLDAFWGWVTASAANLENYRTDAFAALRAFALTRGSTSAVVEELVHALERVRDIRTLLPDQPYAWLRDPTIRRSTR